MVFQPFPRCWRVLSLGLIGSGCVLAMPGSGLAIAPLPPTPLLPRPAAPQPAAPAPALPRAAEFPKIDLLDQGRQHYQAGRLPAAIAAWQQAAEQFQQQGDRAQQALSLSYLSLAHQELSQWSEAKTAIAQSLQLLQSAPTPAAPQKPGSQNSVIWAQVINTEASLLLATGQAEAALSRWQQAQKFYDQAGDIQGSLGAQINQAQAMQQLGFNRRARQQLAQINQRLVQMPDSELKATALRSLGMALQAMGETNGGELLERSLKLAATLNSSRDRGVTLLSLGHLATSKGEFATALDYFEQAEKQSQNPTEQMQARLNQLQLLLQHGQSQEAANLAIQLSQQLQQQLLELSPSRHSLYAAINFVSTLNDLEDPSQLVALADLAKLTSQVVHSAQQLHDRPAQAYALNLWGELYLRTGQLVEAQTVAQKSLAIARDLQADNIIAQSAWQMGRLAKQRQQRAEAIGYYQEAVKSLQAIRGDLVAVNQDVQFSYRESVEPVYRELVELLLAGTPNQAELTQARDLIESLQVAELDNFFREACLDKARQIDQVDPTATVIYPIILPDRLAVILSTAGHPLRYYSTPTSKAETEGAIAAMYQALNPAADSQQRLRQAQQLYDWLIRPAEADQALKDTKTLVFVLDGKLRNIPMSALHDGKQYLIEKYAVTLSPGLQLMASHDLQPSQAQAIIGGISDARSGFAALPGVESEVKAISQMINSATLLNQAFTGKALEDQIKSSSADIVHLATHGQFSSRLEDTFLLTWDGRVNVRDLSELLRSREGHSSKAVELLVLSACDTATGDDRAVLGLAGLAVKSGARSTVATLWPVKDNAASLLMTQFYRNLRQAKTNKAEALRQAQLHLLQKTDFKEPFFWSGVVLVGNWQ